MMVFHFAVKLTGLAGVDVGQDGFSVSCCRERQNKVDRLPARYSMTSRYLCHNFLTYRSYITSLFLHSLLTLSSLSHHTYTFSWSAMRFDTRDRVHFPVRTSVLWPAVAGPALLLAPSQQLTLNPRPATSTPASPLS